jgi:hypothetical protein
MSKLFRVGCLPALLSVALLVGMASADDRTSSATTQTDEKVARLEALLEAQQSQIEALEQQVAAASTQQEDAARVEAMRGQIREILSEQEFRESLMPSVLQAGYDKGFFIRSSDDRFLLKIGGLMQFRWTHYATRKDNRWQAARLQRNDRTGFDFQRVRITFKGHAFSEDLGYFVQLRSDAANGYDTILAVGWIDYRFCDELQFRAGKFKIASTRAAVTSHSQLQFPARPMVETVFGLGYGMGVRFWGQLCDKRLEYYLDVVNSASSGEDFGSGRTITTDVATSPTGTELDSNPALAFRLVWHALGDNPPKDCAGQSDIEFHESPAMDIGFHYAFNEDEGDVRTTAIPYPLPRRIATLGGFGLTNTNGLQINQFGLDAVFKYQGFSATGEYVLRIVDPRRAGRTPFSNWWLFTNQGDTTVQHGAYVQCGYFLPIPGLEKKLEAVARIGGISTLANGQEGTWEYSGGLNYYLEGNSVKVQADVTKITEVPITSNYSSQANVNDDALIFRVQLQVAF